MSGEIFHLWLRRFKMTVLIVAAVVIYWRGSTYIDPSGPGIVPIVMCGLMAFALLLLCLGMATKASDPLFI